MSTPRKRIAWVVGLPVGLTLLAILPGHLEPATFAAPLLGPWAGLAFGHSDCTMGNVMRLPSIALAVLGVAAALALARVERRGAVRVMTVVLGACVVGWEFLAVLSLINMAT